MKAITIRESVEKKILRILLRGKKQLLRIVSRKQKLVESKKKQGCQFGTILEAKWTFLLHKNFNMALKLFQTGNPEKKKNEKQHPL